MWDGGSKQRGHFLFGMGILSDALCPSFVTCFTCIGLLLTDAPWPLSITSLGWDYWLIPYGHSNTCLGWLLTDATRPPPPVTFLGWSYLLLPSDPLLHVNPLLHVLNGVTDPLCYLFGMGLLADASGPLCYCFWVPCGMIDSHFFKKDHFVQRPLRTKKTTSYKNTGNTSYKDSFRTKTILYKGDHSVQKHMIFVFKFFFKI